ncbi:hypothetical protein AQUCO_05700082v1 [Aquilegia coerulea]|uniref:Ubiquitin-like domain-containing protein n=1 Tax=Aquilegia coerulea TaxID=218851 RepID=A0A2G5CFQ4_AQUCA|nr:hypothetical protein AQUCO_05700082v1 [Aquilegia coerulea]
MMRRSKNCSSGDRLSDSSAIRDEEIEWEMRPGGMLVQKRCTKHDVVATPNMIVSIVYGAVRYEISINSQATFGELKKLLASETGLQPVEQQLIFRGKERENGDYLDRCGVKDRSKIVLVEDPSSKEKRYIEMRKNAKIQSAHRAISDISMELDKLVEQVSTSSVGLKHFSYCVELFQQIKVVVQLAFLSLSPLKSFLTLCMSN